MVTNTNEPNQETFRIIMPVTFLMGLNKSCTKSDLRRVVLSEYFIKHIVLP